MATGSGGEIWEKGSNVTIAMDDSGFSEFAFDFYMANLHRPNNCVILVHAAHYKTSFGLASVDVPLELDKAEEEKTRQLKDKLDNLIVKHKLNARIECVRGEYGPSICTVANDNNADYIVVGCSGKGDISKFFKGSVGAYVAQHSSIPVVIARSKERIQLERQQSKARHSSGTQKEH